MGFTGLRKIMRGSVVYVVVSVVALPAGYARAADETAAIDLIRKECSSCHGLRGISVSPTFPHLAGQQAPYLEAQLKAFRDRSRADPHAQAFMWGMAAQLTDATITHIANYLAAQPPAPGTRADPAVTGTRRRATDHSRAWRDSIVAISKDSSERSRQISERIRSCTRIRRT